MHFAPLWVNTLNFTTHEATGQTKVTAASIAETIWSCSEDSESEFAFRRIHIHISKNFTKTFRDRARSFLPHVWWCCVMGAWHHALKNHPTL